MVKIAIIGAGNIAAVHIDAYKMFADQCRITAVCDLFVEKAEACIAAHQLNATAYREIDDLFAHADFDAVSICLPQNRHADIAIKALQCGKHVLVEKPMASSLQECDAMIAAAKASGKVLSVVCQNRFKTPMMKVKQLLENGTIGKVYHTIVNSLWWRGSSYYDLWWRGKWETECGGCMTSHAVHHLDLMQWMIGMPRKVTAVINNLAHDNSECEDIGVAILEYDGMLAQVTSSLVAHGEEQEIIFEGEKGRISVPWKTAASKALPNGFPQDNPEQAAAIQAAYDAVDALPLEGHPAQIENFLRAIAGEASVLIDGAEGRKTIELIMAIYKAASTRQTVTLPLSKDDDFYCKASMIAHMPHFFEKTRSVDNLAAAPITLGRDVGK